VRRAQRQAPAAAPMSALPYCGHPCPCSPLLLLLPPPGGQRLFSRSPPRFLYAELKQPHVEACWRETALRHGYRAATPWRGKDRNLLFVHEEAPAVPAGGGPFGPYLSSCAAFISFSFLFTDLFLFRPARPVLELLLRLDARVAVAAVQLRLHVGGRALRRGHAPLGAHRQPHRCQRRMSFFGRGGVGRYGRSVLSRESDEFVLLEVPPLSTPSVPLPSTLNTLIARCLVGMTR